MSDIDAMPVPDSALARVAADLVRTSAPEVLFNHCQRAYQFGSMLGRKLGWQVDREILYISTALHDLGLTDRFDGQRGFEVEGAAAAESFLLAQGCPEVRVAVVKDAIALHLDTTRLASDPRPEVVLTAMGSGMDTHGLRVDHVHPGFIDTVLESWPRLGFRAWLRATCFAQAQRKPDSPIAWWVNSGRMHEDIGAPRFTE
ncbi:HD domain-containing protein [Nocardia sp. NPDC051052]|uniref:HD domain-containing protein n=1 Tax=Nocardia sp. NPDC051052 TaxID=3364322 RepID=UPI0037BDEDD7